MPQYKMIAKGNKPVFFKERKFGNYLSHNIVVYKSTLRTDH